MRFCPRWGRKCPPISAGRRNCRLLIAASGWNQWCMNQLKTKCWWRPLPPGAQNRASIIKSYLWQVIELNASQDQTSLRWCCAQTQHGNGIAPLTNFYQSWTFSQSLRRTSWIINPLGSNQLKWYAHCYLLWRLSNLWNLSELHQFLPHTKGIESIGDLRDFRALLSWLGIE